MSERTKKNASRVIALLLRLQGADLIDLTPLIQVMTAYTIGSMGHDWIFFPHIPVHPALISSTKHSFGLVHTNKK